MNAVEYYNYIVLQRMKINKMLTVGQIKKILYIKLVEYKVSQLYFYYCNRNHNRGSLQKKKKISFLVYGSDGIKDCHCQEFQQRIASIVDGSEAEDSHLELQGGSKESELARVCGF